MFKINFVTIDEYLTLNRIRLLQLFSRAKNSKIELLLHLEEVEGYIGDSDGFFKRIAITSALCKLSEQQCKKLYLEKCKKLDNINLNLPLSLIEGTYCKLINEENHWRWFNEEIDINDTKRSPAVIFMYPISYSDIGCVSIPINKILIKIGEQK